MLINFFFWSIVFITIHSYLIYPCVIFILSHFFKENKTIYNPTYSVSIIISAFNEEKVIRDRIINISQLKFDFSQLEVLIGSDGSTDQTNDILIEMKEKYPWLFIYLFD